MPFFFLAPQLALADVAASAKTLVENQYAPNYIAPTTDHSEKLLDFHLDGNWYLPSGAEQVQPENSVEEWVRLLNYQQSNGWKGNHLDSIGTEELNEQANESNIVVVISLSRVGAFSLCPLLEPEPTGRGSGVHA